MNKWLVDGIKTQEYQARKSLLYPLTASLFESVGFLITPYSNPKEYSISQLRTHGVTTLEPLMSMVIARCLKIWIIIPKDDE
jgi:uncharacterized membrane protein